MKVCDKTIRGVEVAIEVDTRGIFYANVGEGPRIEAKTLAELEELLSKALRQRSARVAIRACHWDNGRWGTKGELQRGTFTGIHASNNNCMFKIDGEKGVEQLYRPSTYLAEEHAEELERLGKAAEAAQEALDSFIEEHSRDIQALIIKAVADAKG